MGVQKCSLYLAGTKFTVITDHQPLVGVMNGKNLDAITNMRIHRIMSKLIGYQFKVLWTPGKTHQIADALSRALVFKLEENEDIFTCSVLVAKEEASEEPIDPAHNQTSYQTSRRRHILSEGL